MGYSCDFCGDQRSMVYCRSDAACLCLSCDHNVHSANALSKRHSRTLLCERCNAQPALVRCTEERISFCQNCDLMSHGSSTSATTHKRQTISCYSGCPSAAELSSIWSFVLDSPSVTESTCEQELGLMSIAESSDRSTWSPENAISQNVPGPFDGNEAPELAKPNVWVCTSSIPESSSVPKSLEWPSGSANDTMPKLCCPTTGPALCEDVDLYADFNVDEMDLNLENYQELFGVSLNDSEELSENGGIESLFATPDMSGADSNCQAAVAAEPAYSNAASADSMISAKTEPIICFTTRQTHSGPSFSGITGESNTIGYQDRRASSMLLMGKPPWYHPCPENSFPSTNPEI